MLSDAKDVDPGFLCPSWSTRRVLSTCAGARKSDVALASGCQFAFGGQLEHSRACLQRGIASNLRMYMSRQRRQAWSVLNLITGSMSNHSAECDIYDIICVQCHKGLLDSKAQRRLAHKIYNACPQPSRPVHHQQLSVRLHLRTRCTCSRIQQQHCCWSSDRGHAQLLLLLPQLLHDVPLTGHGSAHPWHHQPAAPFSLQQQLLLPAGSGREHMRMCWRLRPEDAVVQSCMCQDGDSTRSLQMLHMCRYFDRAKRTASAAAA